MQSSGGGGSKEKPTTHSSSTSSSVSDQSKDFNSLYEKYRESTKALQLSRVSILQARSIGEDLDREIKTNPSLLKDINKYQLLENCHAHKILSSITIKINRLLKSASYPDTKMNELTLKLKDYLRIYFEVNSIQYNLTIQNANGKEFKVKQHSEDFSKYQSAYNALLKYLENNEEALSTTTFTISKPQRWRKKCSYQRTS